eukprot:CAMPEP_0113677242 /NCGR_PEP_ID=MMETSP0038_2-20120614/9142_1 /TAXON_ID=2898 /ORGANISM="Cryptomonas paramecium" /LENGTH=81 /DNA_ID=CAMNT_0000594465 /DNA_START=611 /DNA_END=853 /DNA_ORIENTATION=+ /assembly_acc=CAM_ASM_000170
MNNKIGLEEQNGFTPGRGSLDGIFSLKVALQKRREHGLVFLISFPDLECPSTTSRRLATDPESAALLRLHKPRPPPPRASF